MSRGLTELQLNGKSPLRRILNLRADGRLSATVYPISPRNPVPMLAYTNAEISRCRLRMIQKYSPFPVLWVGDAAFDVSVAEAEKIRDTFEPLGLRIETEASAADLAPVIAPASERRA